MWDVDTSDGDILLRIVFPQALVGFKFGREVLFDEEQHVIVCTIDLVQYIYVRKIQDKYSHLSRSASRMSRRVVEINMESIDAV